MKARGILALVAAALVHSACSGADAGEANERPVRIAVRPFITYAPLYLADRYGHFAARGVEVEFVQIPTAARAIPLLLNGDIDVLPAPVSPAFLHAMAAGEPLRYVADKGWVDPEGCDFFVFAGLPERFASRAGGGPNGRLRVSRSQEPQINFFLERVLSDRFGLSLEDEAIESFNLPPSAELVAVGDGALDGAMMIDPQLGVAIRDHGFEPIARITDVLPGLQFSLLAYGPRLLERDPDLGRRFMEGYLAGVRDYARGKTAENVAALAEATGLDEDMVRESCWISVRPDGVANIASLGEYVAWYAEMGWLETAPNLDDTWDGSFVEHATRTLENEHTEEYE